MPTPGERRALIFVASVAALGVAVRGWREFHPQESVPLAGNRAALARQIEAVDSAIAVTSSKRKPRAPKPETPRPDPVPRAARSRSAVRSRLAPDTQPRDPRQAYWDRIAHFDSIRLGLSSHPSSGARRPPSHPSSANRRPDSDAPPVDLDVAPLDEVARIALLGPALARRIVQDRIANGPFGTITGLQRIPGLTPAFARRLSPYVTFSLEPRHESAGQPPRSKNVRKKGGDSRP